MTKALCEGTGMHISGLAYATGKWGRYAKCPECGRFVAHYQRAMELRDVVYIDRHYREEEEKMTKISYVVNVQVSEDIVESFGGEAEVQEGSQLQLTLDMNKASELPAVLQDAITEEVYEQLDGVKQELARVNRNYTAMSERVVGLRDTNNSGHVHMLNKIDALDERIGEVKRDSAVGIQTQFSRLQMLEQDVEGILQRSDEEHSANGRTRVNLETLKEKVEELVQKHNALAARVVEDTPQQDAPSVQTLDMLADLAKLLRSQNLTGSGSSDEDEDDEYIKNAIQYNLTQVQEVVDLFNQDDYGWVINARIYRIKEIIQATRNLAESL